MKKIGVIVEGNGDTKAALKLANRIIHHHSVQNISFTKSYSTGGCGGMDKRNSLETHIKIALAQLDGVLVLRDSDEKCPIEIFQNYSDRIAKLNIQKPINVAIAVKEMENWFCASFESLAGQDWDGEPGLSKNVVALENPEEVDGKAFINKHRDCTSSYKESIHQHILAGMIDINLCQEKSQSFRIFCKRVLVFGNLD